MTPQQFETGQQVATFIAPGPALATLPPLPGITFVGIGHRARNGKDSLATLLSTLLGPQARVYHFADPLKAYCRIVCGMTGKDGPLLQQIGTNILRAQDPDIWLRTTYWTVADDRPVYAIVPDMRFPNEADFVKQMGGVTVQVRRICEDGTQFTDPHRDPNHSSERALDGYAGWDYRFDIPDGHPECLNEAARWLVGALAGR